MSVSANLQNLPGFPITASYVATNTEIAPSLGRNLAAGVRGTSIVDIIPTGEMYEDRLTQLDVRFSKMLRVGQMRLQGMFDAYNVLNANTVLTATNRFGPAWLRPTAILPARLFKVGAQLDF
jgi:hypothetical protein